MPPKKASKAKEEAKAKAKAAAAKKEEPEPKAKAKAAPKQEEPEKKAPEPKKEEPPAKKARKEEEQPVTPLPKATPKAVGAPSPASEQETDAPSDKRPALKEEVTFRPNDCTLNVVPTVGNKVLMSLSEGGMQYLIAGARANVGMKAGRYMYEVKIIEALSPSESAGPNARVRGPTPRQLLRVGFSTADSHLVLGQSEEHVCFDSEGAFFAGKQKKPSVSGKFTKEQVVSVVLNLDPSSPNANTISAFRDGERIAQPQKIPEALVGKTLFPHISFRNVNVQVFVSNPEPCKALPFKCRTLASAAQADVTVTPNPQPKDGKYEVALPVGVPDEGTFAWLDGFLTKHPDFVELSDRSIIDWATASGLTKHKGIATQGSNDKPEFNFGLPGMDDLSVRRVLSTVAPLMPRNYVVMEVKANLTEADRKETLQRFCLPQFKKVAHVVMGEPSEDFKSEALERLLKAKQDKANISWKAKKAEEKKKKDIEKRQKKLAKMRKKAEEARKKAAEEAKKKAEDAKKRAEAARKKAEKEKKKKEEAEKRKAEGLEEEDKEESEKEEEETKMEVDEEVKDESKDDVKEEDDEDEDEAEEEDKETEPPAVELTDDEKKQWFGSTGTHDLAPTVLNTAISGFSIPQKDEGFDAIKFEWQNAAASQEYLHKWLLEKKKNLRVEGIKPGDDFKEKHKEWTKLFSEWQAKQRTFKTEQAKKDREAAKKKAEDKVKKAKELAAKKAAGEEVEDEEEEEEDALPEECEIETVEDINDIGDGVPLYKQFAMEDWALSQLRYELYSLQKAFVADVNDSDRPGIPQNHFAFYYQKYFGKVMMPKNFGVSNATELAALVKDTVAWDEATGLLTSPLDDEGVDLTTFVKLAEGMRRERQRRIDAGDETARIKLSPLALTGQAAPKATSLSSPPSSATASPRPSGAWAPAPKTFSGVARPALPYSRPAFPPGGAFGGKGKGGLGGFKGAKGGKGW